MTWRQKSEPVGADFYLRRARRWITEGENRIAALVELTACLCGSAGLAGDFDLDSVRSQLLKCRCCIGELFFGSLRNLCGVNLREDQRGIQSVLGESCGSGAQAGIVGERDARDESDQKYGPCSSRRKEALSNRTASKFWYIWSIFIKCFPFPPTPAFSLRAHRYPHRGV